MVKITGLEKLSQVDLDANEFTVSDNGTGFISKEFELFVAPNFSYHKGYSEGTRGSKGVGATYLAFGFDSFQVTTKSESFKYSGTLKGGRTWLEDNQNETESPKIRPNPKKNSNLMIMVLLLKYNLEESFHDQKI